MSRTAPSYRAARRNAAKARKLLWRELPRAYNKIGQRAVVVPTPGEPPVALKER